VSGSTRTVFVLHRVAIFRPGRATAPVGRCEPCNPDSIARAAEHARVQHQRILAVIEYPLGRFDGSPRFNPARLDNFDAAIPAPAAPRAAIWISLFNGAPPARHTFATRSAGSPRCSRGSRPLHGHSARTLRHARAFRSAPRRAQQRHRPVIRAGRDRSARRCPVRVAAARQCATRASRDRSSLWPR
jgi:hypothetical protein